MVKCYVYLYKGSDNGSFTNGELYIGRTNKSGQQMARDNNGVWQYVTNAKMTIVRLNRYMEIVETFYVDNHKEALMQLLIYDNEKQQVIRTNAYDLVKSIYGSEE